MALHLLIMAPAEIHIVFCLNWLYNHSISVVSRMQGLRSEILHGVPDHVYRRVRELEDSFMVGTPELKKTTNHFIKGLEKGSVPCCALLKPQWRHLLKESRAYRGGRRHGQSNRRQLSLVTN